MGNVTCVQRDEAPPSRGRGLAGCCAARPQPQGPKPVPVGEALEEENLRLKQQVYLLNDGAVVLGASPRDLAAPQASTLPKAPVKSHNKLADKCSR